MKIFVFKYFFISLWGQLTPTVINVEPPMLFLRMYGVPFLKFIKFSKDKTGFHKS